ncbi:hypothetical protein CKA32_005787 [Geitlerinema sp. FC II]|nr:hypothetical protein CKA32_005787 [Geitlerinema sp. FC II]
MTQAELFDIIELIIKVPGCDRAMGSQGTIVECLDDNYFKVEFTNESGETTALCTLSPREFIVVWKAETQQWLTTSEKAIALFKRLSDEQQEEVLDFARFLYQKNFNRKPRAENAFETL